MDPDSQYFPLFLLVSPPTLNLYFYLALLLLTIAINTIVSGAEVAFFSLKSFDKENIKKSDTKVDSILNILLNNQERLLLSIIIAYNFLNILIICLTALSVHSILLKTVGYVSELWIDIIVSAFILLVIIEIIPKLYASINPLKFARKHAKIIQFINTITYTFSYFLVNSKNIVRKSSIERKTEITMDELSLALEVASDENIQEQKKDMLKGIIRFKDTIVDDILIPRTEVFSIDKDWDFEEVVKFIVGAGFSRIPVFEENPDRITGVLYVKDLFPYLHKDKDFNWQKLIRQAYFVPATKRIDDLLEEFRTNKNHMAIVVDEYGATIGLITMEDILEEIVGDISDEYDEEKDFYKIDADGNYIFDGKTPLIELTSILGVSENYFNKVSEEIDTLAGLMLELKGDFPTLNEIFTFKNLQFQVLEIGNNYRIDKIRLKKLLVD